MEIKSMKDFEGNFMDEHGFVAAGFGTKNIKKKKTCSSDFNGSTLPGLPLRKSEKEKFRTICLSLYGFEAKKSRTCGFDPGVERLVERRWLLLKI